MTIESAFLDEINKKDPLKVIPFYADWLEDESRLEEANYWRWILKNKLAPFKNKPSFGQGIESLEDNPALWIELGESKTISWDWLDHEGKEIWPGARRSVISSKHLWALETYNGKRFSRDNIPGWREYPTKVFAYKVLFEAWKKINAKNS